MSEELKEKLEVARSLLGIKGIKMSDAELIMEMATLSIETLKRKKLGKASVQQSPTTLTKRCGNELRLKFFSGIKSAPQISRDI